MVFSFALLTSELSQSEAATEKLWLGSLHIRFIRGRRELRDYRREQLFGAIGRYLTQFFNSNSLVKNSEGGGMYFSLEIFHLHWVAELFRSPINNWSSVQLLLDPLLHCVGTEPQQTISSSSLAHSGVNRFKTVLLECPAHRIFPTH